MDVRMSTSIRLPQNAAEVMLEVFAAPPRDRYQIITEHPVGLWS